MDTTHRILAVMLICAMMFCSLAGLCVNASQIGNTRGTVSWKFDTFTETLTLYGTGEPIADFNSEFLD